jgi:hypothetical protein
MKTYSTFVLTALISLFLVTPAFSDSLDDLVTSAQKAVLLKEGAITQIAREAESPELAPRNAHIQRLTAGIIAELEPSILTESLHIYKKPSARPWNEAEKTALYNNILALSTLAGIQYYSASRKAMRTFYEISEVIDAPSSKKPVNDPSYATPPASLTVYARQKDLTFGDNVYQYDYFVYDDALALIQQNLTTMTAGIVPAVGKNKLRSTVAVVDAGEYILIYAASFAKTVSLPGMKDRIGSSFSNRADAVLGWFSKQADKVFN